MVTVFPSSNLTEASPGGLSGFFSCAMQVAVHTAMASMTNIPRRLLRIALSCCLQIVTSGCRSIIHAGAERYNSMHGHSGRKVETLGGRLSPQSKSRARRGTSYEYSGRKARRTGPIRVHDGCAAGTA